MKATLLAGAFVSFLSVSAFGADLGVPAIAPIAPPPFTWTGCYAGAQAAGGWWQKDLNDSAGIVSPITGFTSANLNISGYLLGANSAATINSRPIGWSALKARHPAEISAAASASPHPGFPATARPTGRRPTC